MKVLLLFFLSHSVAGLRGNQVKPDELTPVRRPMMKKIPVDMVSDRGDVSINGGNVSINGADVTTTAPVTAASSSGNDDPSAEAFVSSSNANNIRACPSQHSNYYQSFQGNDVVPCRTNTDCNWYDNMDGPPYCCVHPQCICGSANVGASPLVGCVESP